MCQTCLGAAVKFPKCRNVDDDVGIEIMVVVGEVSYLTDEKGKQWEREIFTRCTKMQQ